ncbi:MAG: hypothetical protein ABL876_14985 [Chitinophagaceae bacterium]
MKNIVTLVVVFVALVFASVTATAQDIKPRGFVSAVPATTAAAPTATPTTTTTADKAEVVETLLEEVKRVEAIAREAKGLSATANERVEKLTKAHNGWVEEFKSHQTSSNRNFMLYGVFIVILLGAVMVLFVFNFRKKLEAPGRAGRTLGSILVFALGLGFTSYASAQTPTNKPAAECKITGVSTGQVLVKEQDPASVTINVRNCSEVTAITIADVNVTFTDFLQKANVLTAKVAATASALTGPTSFKITKADGTEVQSPDAVYFLVLDMQTAVVRKDAVAANTKVAKQVTEVKKIADTTSKTVTAIQNQLNTITTSKITTEEAKTLIAEATKPLEAKVAELEASNTSLKQAVMEGAAKTEALITATTALADIEAAMANTKVKKGVFRGKKALDPELAQKAIGVRDAVSSMKKQ